MSGTHTKNLGPLAKLFQVMRIRIICWQGYRTIYFKM